MMLFQRRLFLELMGNALTTILLLVFVLLLVTSVSIVHKIEGLTFIVFLKTLPVFAATALDLVVPMSVLVAVVLTFGRAMADNEVDTLRASGIHPLQLLTPGLVFGMLMTALLLIGMDYGKPYAERAKRRLTKDVDVARVLALKLASGEPEWLDERTLISAGSIDDAGITRDLRIQFFDGEGRVEREIIAESARTYVDEEAWTLVVELHVFTTVVGPRFSGRKTTIERPLKREAVDLTIRAMTTPQLLAWLERSPQRRSVYAQAEVETEVHMRLASSATCLIFVILGLPVALRFRRHDRIGAFLVAFLLALFLYYPSQRVSKVMAEEGILPAMVASWSGHAFLVLVSLGLSWRVLKR